MSQLGDFFAAVVQDLKHKFHHVEYGLTTFNDRSFVDDTRWEYSSRDDLYREVQPLTSDATLIADAQTNVTLTETTYAMQNQWDALFQTAISQGIGWHPSDQDGNDVIRIALMVTDGGAHTDHNTFDSNVRNLNHEWFYNQGPHATFHDPANVMAHHQHCDLVQSVQLTNTWNHVIGSTSDHLSPGTGQWGEWGGPCWGWKTAKAGALRSLKGRIGFWNYMYGLDSPDLETPAQMSDQGVNYWNFLQCCTESVSDYLTWTSTCLTSNKTEDDVWEDCVSYGGPYARCYYGDGHTTMLDDHGWTRQRGCVEDSAHWDAAQRTVPSPDFYTGKYGASGTVSDDQDILPDLLTIPDYPYNEHASQGWFEYPNPKDIRYSQGFQRNKVIPVVATFKTATSPYLGPDDPNTYYGYDRRSLQLSAQHCPGLEWDPWSSLACTLESAPECYSAKEYPELYPERFDRTNWSLWGGADDEVWWHRHCDHEECADQWYRQCFQMEYGDVIQHIQDTGVEAYYAFTADGDPNARKDWVVGLVTEITNAHGCNLPLINDVPILSTTSTSTIPPMPRNPPGEIGTYQRIVPESSEASNMGAIVGGSICASILLGGVCFLLIRPKAIDDG